jgi:hypothetical protein
MYIVDDIPLFKTSLSFEKEKEMYIILGILYEG